MKKAPAFNCSVCDRRIGKDRSHYLLDQGEVVDTRCAENRSLHTLMRPGCPDRWHDLLDHLDSTGTRAGIAAAKGVWP